jgi:hypothetical protein
MTELWIWGAASIPVAIVIILIVAGGNRKD